MPAQKTTTFENVFENAPIPMWICSRKSGKILRVNRETALTAGYPESQLIGMTLDQFFQPVGRDLPSLLRKVNRSRKPVQAVGHLSVKDGRIKLCRVTFTAQRFQSRNAYLVAVNHVLQPEEPGPLGTDSEERWRALVQHSRDFICTINRDGQILYLNRTVPGLNVDNINEHTIFEFIPPEQQKKPREAVEKVFREGLPAEYEVRAVGPHGQLSWYATRIGPVFENNKVVRANLVSVDITDQKNAMEEVRYIQSYLRTLYEVSPDMIFLFDHRCHLIDVNKNVESVTGFSREELLGEGFKHLIETGPHFLEKICRALTGEPADLEKKLRRKTGDAFVCEFRFRRVEFMDVSGTAKPHVLAIARDISRRKQQEEETKRRIRQLVALRQAVEMLTGTVELEPLLETILTAARLAIPSAEKGSILLYDESSGEVSIRALSGYRDPRVKSVQLAPQTGYVSRVIAQKEAILITDAQSDSKIRYHGEIEEIRAIQSAVVAPLMVKKRLIGAISLDNSRRKNAFDSNDLKLLVSFAAPAAAAIENARLYAALQESESRYRTLIEHAPEGICVYDSNSGRFVDANSNICRMFGLSRKAFLAKNPIAISEPVQERGIPVRKEIAEKIKSVREHGQLEFEWQFIRADGSGFPAQVRLVMLPPGQQNLIRATITDITERKEAEKTIQQYTNQLRIYQNIDRAILSAESLEEIAAGAIGEIQKLIPSERTSVLIFNWEKEEAELIALKTALPTRMPKGSRIPFHQFHRFEELKKHSVIMVDDLRKKKNRSPIQKAILAEGIRSYFHISLISHDQFIGLLNISSTRPNAFHGSHIEMAVEIANQLSIAIYQEMLKTEIRKYSEQLEQKVLERTADLEAFAYSVSHDLRAPLRAMNGFARALSDDYGSQFDAEGRRYIHQIAAAAQRMDRLIKDLLEYSRLGQQEINLEAVNTRAVLKQILKSMDDEISRKKAVVRVKKSIPPVMAQASILEQVLRNLLENSLKFTYPHRPPVISVRAEMFGKKVRIWIEDNGVGIAAEYLARIFNVFERLYPVEMYPGTGIGLAIVEKAVRKMGGRVGVESEPEKGSRFWIELAAAKSQNI